MLVGRTKDTRLMVVYGYARLVAYDEELQLVPDILKDVEVEDGRSFTLHLRPGHRWSDGQPFTSEDFRYWWEDVANNEQLSPTGPPALLYVDGEPPQVEFPDELTVRYSWSKPNPFFLPSLAAATPTFIYMPAHYLKQFHEKYADPDKLATMVADAQARDWAQLHGRKDGMYNFDNPDLPTLQPWRLTTPLPAEHFLFERNEYYHRVDPNGQQLPYIDRVVFDVVDDKLIPVKTGAGGDRSAITRPVLQALHLPQGERAAQRPGHVPLGDGAGRPSRDLSQSQHQRRGLARAVPGRAVPARAVARRRPRRDQPDHVLRARHRRRQHRAAQEPAVQAGVPRHLGTVRSGAGQRAARRDRPDRALR